MPPSLTVEPDPVWTTNISSGGLYAKTFRPVPLAVGDFVEIRVTVPDARSSHDHTSILGPYATGCGVVERIESVLTEGIRGWGIAVRFQGPLTVSFLE